MTEEEIGPKQQEIDRLRKRCQDHERLGNALVEAMGRHRGYDTLVVEVGNMADLIGALEDENGKLQTALIELYYARKASYRDDDDYAGDRLRAAEERIKVLAAECATGRDEAES